MSAAASIAIACTSHIGDCKICRSIPNYRTTIRFVVTFRRLRHLPFRLMARRNFHVGPSVHDSLVFLSSVLVQSRTDTLSENGCKLPHEHRLLDFVLYNRHEITVPNVESILLAVSTKHRVEVAIKDYY